MRLLIKKLKIKKMKKTSQIIGMMCMAAVMFIGASSCKKDDAKMVSSFDFNLPAIEGESGIDDAKAYINMTTGYMNWYEGDDIMMYSIDEDYTKSEAAVFRGDAGITGSTSAHFAGGALPEGNVGFFAFYPASKASTQIEEGNRVTFNVGEKQACETDLFAGTSYAGKIFMDPTGYVGAATCEVIHPYANATMNHIFGYINVRVKNTGTGDYRLKSVTITDNNRFLTGEMSITIPELKAADLNAMKQLGIDYKANGNLETYLLGMETALHNIGYMASGLGHSVTLDCSKVNAQIDGSYKFFLIPIRPGALMGDFTITLEFFGKDEMDINVPADKKYISIPGNYTNVSIDLNNGVL